MEMTHGRHRGNHDGCLICEIVYRLGRVEEEVFWMSQAWNDQTERFTRDWQTVASQVSALNAQVTALNQQIQDATGNAQSAVDASIAQNAADLSSKLDAFEQAFNLAAQSTPEVPQTTDVDGGGDSGNGGGTVDPNDPNSGNVVPNDPNQVSSNDGDQTVPGSGTV